LDIDVFTMDNSNTKKEGVSPTYQGFDGYARIAAYLAYNILRFIGQPGLLGEKTPVRHPAKRRRIKTVIQELIYFAARRGRRLKLRFSRHSGFGFEAFRTVYHRLAYGQTQMPASMAVFAFLRKDLRATGFVVPY
jgi:hypothetical protein